MGDADERDGTDAGTGTGTDAGTGIGIETPPVGFGAAAGLVAVAFVGAATAGVLDSVGPYLLGVAALVAVLFVLARP